MSSQPEKPSSQPQDSSGKLMATLSEAGAAKIVDHARNELTKVLEAAEPKTMSEPPSSGSGKVRAEVTEAAVKFTDGVDVITETLILILGKFRTIIFRTTVGMAFGACVLVICLLVARQSWKTALIEEQNTQDIAQVTAQLKEALAKLDNIQKAADATEQKVDAVKQTADSHPSIEIVPDKGRPGKAKVVIRPPVTSATQARPAAPKAGGLKMRIMDFEEPPPAKAEAAPAPADLVEIPIQIPQSN